MPFVWKNRLLETREKGRGASLTLTNCFKPVPGVKGVVSPMFSITVKSQKTHVYRWISNNDGPVLLKLLLYRTETITKCVWLRMARMEVSSNSKTSGRFFQVFARVSDKIGKN